ncbi:MAG TPA: zf-HC2 domain-containing protein [Thermoanaerobaculia bacterium]|nr:zf-HC2 domain-containing protein [Thermoanaerobaculia bacterium]
MNEWHPDLDSLARFLDDELADAESRAVQRHLATCGRCEGLLRELLPVPQPAAPAQPVPAADLPAYRSLIRRVLAEARPGVQQRRSLLQVERDAAAALWAELRPLTADERRSRLLGDPRFHNWGLFELMTTKARQAVLVEPKRAESLLCLVLELTDLLDPERYGPGAVESAQGRAWSYLGNTWRILGDFWQAEQAFQNAEQHFSRGWLDPLDDALLLTLKASLRRAQRRFDEAHRMLDEAVAIYREVNEPHLQGRALMKKGLTWQSQGEFEAAITCLRNCLFLLDGNQEARLLVAAQANLILCLHDSGQSRAAAALIPEARQLLLEVGKRGDLLRLRWTEGRVLAALQRNAEAEAAFLEVREGFVDDRAVYDAALVCLDLAALYARQGRTAEVRRLVSEMLPVFRACDVHREAIAALIVLEKAEEKELTLGLLEEVAGFLKQVRSNPALRFRDAEPAASPS